jgi:nucleotide-binding universal stress UspA family protein
MAFQKILIAVDGSPIAARSAEVGIELAQSLVSEVAFIYVVDPAENTMPEGGVPASDLLAMAQEEGKRFLAGFRERSALQPPTLEFLEVGKPGTEIVKAAEDWSADMIVIGSHGRGGLGRLLLGSVAEAVVRQASCPVLVVRRQA